LLGGAHLVNHAAGWMHGGLTASCEKLILDAEMLGMMQAMMAPIPTDPAALALEAIAAVGPGGHFFGSDHTQSRYQTAFHTPMLSNWDNHPQWLARGSVTAEQRANAIWKDLLAGYDQPPLDPARAEAIAAYVIRRKAQGGAPMN